MPMNATMLCTDFNKNFSPKLDGGDENGLAKRRNLGKYSQKALEQLKRGHAVNYSKGCLHFSAPLLPGELKSIEWDILSSFWGYI